MEQNINEKLPKVMVVGINAWREDATSHTLMNIFSCWQSTRLSLVYTRADLPNTAVCSRYFQISENEVLKSVFKRDIKTGKEVFNTSIVDETLVREEHDRYAKARKKRSFIMVLCREMVWFLGKWKTNALREFVKEVDPDVLFIPIYPTVFMGWVQRYIQKITDKPMVCYLFDDNYSYLSCKGFLSYIHRFLLRKQVKYLATHCEEMFVIVDKAKEEADRLFGTNSVLLTKGVNFSDVQRREHTLKKPIKFVYTGNLIIGRDKTLALLADMLNEINKDKEQVLLEIYSPDQVGEETMKRLNFGCSKHCGFISRERVTEVQKEADVVVFAEALEGKDSNAARLSFSTKITDYLSNGKCILAIGKEEIAPIDYFVRNDSAIVATNQEQLREKLSHIISNPEIIHEYEKKAFDCAKQNHDKELIDARLIRTICKVIKKESNE